MSENMPKTELVDMSELMSTEDSSRLVLSQLAGPGHPRELRVLPFQEILLGRSDECHVVLDEEAVSRCHAKVRYADRRPELVDLSSTNGTFLNLKPVQRATLKSGDRIQVGTSIFTVAIEQNQPILAEDSDDESEVSRLESLIKAKAGRAAQPPKQSSAISGQLAEIRLASVLQIIEADRSTGTLSVRHGEKEGTVFIHEGSILHATFGSATGPKALYRLMVLEDGRFELFIPGRLPQRNTVDGTLSKHLLEAMRQKDELAQYKQQLPPENSRLTFNPRAHIAPAKVPAGVFEVMAAVQQHKEIGKVIEFCELPDLDICRILMLVLNSGAVTLDTGETSAKPRMAAQSSKTVRVNPEGQ